MVSKWSCLFLSSIFSWTVYGWQPATFELRPELEHDLDDKPFADVHSLLFGWSEVGVMIHVDDELSVSLSSMEGKNSTICMNNV